MVTNCGNVYSCCASKDKEQSEMDETTDNRPADKCHCQHSSDEEEHCQEGGFVHPEILHSHDPRNTGVVT